MNLFDLVKLRNYKTDFNATFTSVFLITPEVLWARTYLAIVPGSEASNETVRQVIVYAGSEIYQNDVGKDSIYFIFSKKSYN